MRALIARLRLSMSPKCRQNKHSECTLFTDQCACWCHG